MPRLLHGEVVKLPSVEVATALLGADNREAATALLRALESDLHNFDFLFPALQDDPANLLPEPPPDAFPPDPALFKTRDALVALGRTMEDPFDRIDPPPPAGTNPGDANVPAGFTYFGQFVDHDITLEASSSGTGLTSGDVNALLERDLATGRGLSRPLPLSTIRDVLRNLRTATLDLDSVYGPPAQPDPDDADKMRLGKVVDAGPRPPHVVDEFHDVPRQERSNSPEHDRAAIIGDPRNDENLIVSQLHVAFLRAHNALVGQGNTFDQARRILRQHYQHLVLHDFLPKVADPTIVNDVIQNGPEHYDPPEGEFFLPYEYAVAVYRFGHTMVRNRYNFNLNFNNTFDGNAPPPPFGLATLHDLFTFTALSGQIGEFDTLPQIWIIEWKNFVDASGGVDPDEARRMDTKLVEPGLFRLQDTFGGTLDPSDPTIPDVEKDKRRLAVRNLLRGYLLRIPTGQAVAQALGITPLTAGQIEAAAASPQQVAALQAGGFSNRTPLWYYILAEAQHGGGQHLGPVGSTLVAEVLVGLAKRSEDSILTDPAWSGPTLPSATPGTFTLADLLRFAGVLGDTAVNCRYTVVPGDTLSEIAQKLYGDLNEWPRIFQANQDQIANPNVIQPGQVLRIPARGQHTVVAGDSLSGIAQQVYGNASRWRRIFRANRDQISDPDTIFPGQVLCIP